MTDTVVVLALLALVMALALPVAMIGFSRLPRMDREGDDFGVKDEPLLGWPPKAEDHAQAKRLMRVLLMWMAAFVLLLLALMISLGHIELPQWFERLGPISASAQMADLQSLGAWRGDKFPLYPHPTHR